MQGTIAMLMALGGLGCHHKNCAPVVDSCYSACYGASYSGGWAYASPQGGDVVMATAQTWPAAQSQGWSGCYATTGWSSCYGACYSGGHHGGWDSCYASTCYAPRKHCGLFGGGGLFGHKRRAAANCDPCALGRVDAYSACYSLPVYGSYTPAYSTGQVMTPPASTGAMPPPDTGAAAVPPATDAKADTPPPAPAADAPKVDAPAPDAPKPEPEAPKVEPEAPRVVPDAPKPAGDTPKSR